jgi:hypothetical protein
VNRTIFKTVNEPQECKIFIGGDFDTAQRVCVNYCTKIGLCVTVTKTTYCYRGGSCEGVIIGLINYPRFPSTTTQIWGHAMNLAYELKAHLGQGSFTVQNQNVATFVSDRDEDQ